MWEELREALHTATCMEDISIVSEPVNRRRGFDKPGVLSVYGDSGLAFLGSRL